MKKLCLILVFLQIMSINICNAVSIRSMQEAEKTTALSAVSYDKNQTIAVIQKLFYESYGYAVAEINGNAYGKRDNSISGTINLWLSLGPDEMRGNSDNPLPEWNIMLSLRPNQTPEQTAKALAGYVNANMEKPYYARAYCNKVIIYYKAFYNKMNKRADKIKYSAILNDTN